MIRNVRRAREVIPGGHFEKDTVSIVSRSKSWISVVSICLKDTTFRSCVYRFFPCFPHACFFFDFCFLEVVEVLSFPSEESEAFPSVFPFPFFWCCDFLFEVIFFVFLED